MGNCDTSVPETQLFKFDIKLLTISIAGVTGVYPCPEQLFSFYSNTGVVNKDTLKTILPPKVRERFYCIKLALSFYVVTLK